MEQACDWIWVMDDDACPEPGALEALIKPNSDPFAIYAAAAMADTGDADRLVWPAMLIGGPNAGRTVQRVDGLAVPLVSVENAPFIGMLFHRSLIECIGLPDKNFFVSGDDAEFCARAWKQAHGVRLVPSAIVRHPRMKRRFLKLGQRQCSVIELTPWRRYYDTRNRLVIAKGILAGVFGPRLLPGPFSRWLVTLWSNRIGWRSRAHLCAVFMMVWPDAWGCAGPTVAGPLRRLHIPEGSGCYVVRTALRGGRFSASIPLWIRLLVIAPVDEFGSCEGQFLTAVDQSLDDLHALHHRVILVADLVFPGAEPPAGVNVLGL